MGKKKAAAKTNEERINEMAEGAFPGTEAPKQEEKKFNIKVNKSAEIRKAIADNPTASTAELVTIINKTLPADSQVTAPTVSQMKSKLNKGGKPKKGKGKKAAAAKSSDNGAYNLGAIAAARQVIQAAGGIEQAKRLLDAIGG